MQKIQLIVVGAFIGFAVSVAGVGLSEVRAQQQGYSPAEAQALLSREQAVLDQIRPQIMQMQADLRASSRMSMTPAEESMQKELNGIAAMCRILWQTDGGLANVMQMELQLGAHNK
jgi:hypothetical protein